MTLSFNEVCRRAGGRRRYNLQRQLEARERRKEVGRLLDLYGNSIRGTQARIARELGVSEATISRDISSLQLKAWLDSLPAHRQIRLMRRAGLLS